MTLAVVLCVACTAEQTFTSGRLEVLCDEVIPVCDLKASCLLTGETYLDDTFPGGHRLVVHSATDDATLVLRFLIVDPVYPGTEMVMRAHTPGCVDFEEERLVDVDFFQLAGKERVLEFSLPLGPRGDHLVELFSDMTARYLMTTTVE